MELNEFHHTRGWYFKRLDDGIVRIRVDNTTTTTEHTIPAAEWASIVGHVAHVRAGDEAAKYTAALDLHTRMTATARPGTARGVMN